MSEISMESLRNRVDPALLARLDKVRGLESFTTIVRTPEIIAREAEIWKPYAEYSLPQVNVENISIPGPHGPIPLRIFTPLDAQPEYGFVWIHGGAFFFGDLDMPESDHIGRELCQRLNAAVVSVDYRLVNEKIKFPIPLDDCLAAWNWSVNESNLVGNEIKWFIGGASAGGNLATATTLRTRNGEGPLPAGLLAIYPVEHRQVPRSDFLLSELEVIPDFVRFPKVFMVNVNVSYLGDNPGTSPEAFPGDAKDLSGFPRTLITVNEFDDLRESGTIFASQLRDAGNEVVEYTELGFIHGHMNVVGHPSTAQTLTVMAEFVKSTK